MSARSTQSLASNFYPRPPRGGRQICHVAMLKYMLFLSTPSARRATCGDCMETMLEVYFYPRPPRGGRRTFSSYTSATSSFLSTPSARRATQGACGPGIRQRISIHALREEGDTAGVTTLPAASNFYPRPPRGGRQGNGLPMGRPLPISIHALREEGDDKVSSAELDEKISIHALREEGDRISCGRNCRASYFYPRPPRGGRLTDDRQREVLHRFLSTPSARRATNPAWPAIPLW